MKRRTTSSSSWASPSGLSGASQVRGKEVAMGRSRGSRVGGPGGLVSLSFEEKRLSHCVPVSVSPQLCCSTKVSEGNSGHGGEEPLEPQVRVWGRLEVRGGFGMIGASRDWEPSRE